MKRGTAARAALVAVLAGTVLCGTASASSSKSCNRHRAADLVLTDGSVYTVDRKRTTASAVAVEDGKIAYVGDRRHAMSLACRSTPVVDLDGKMVLPGFVDGHNHVSDHPEALFWLNVTPLRTIEEYGQALLAFRAKDPAMEQIRVIGWNERLILETSASTGLSPKELLDQYVPDIPVVAIDNPHHTMWVNSKALENAGVDENTPDPGGGIIDRIPGTPGFGEPSGVLREFAAQDLVVRALPQPDSTVEQFEAAILDWEKLAAARGVTSVLVPQPRPSENFYRALQRLDDAGRLTVNYDVAIWADEQRGTEQIPELVRLRRKYGGDKFKIDTIKIFGTGNGTGLVWDQDVLNETVTQLDRKGFRVYVHVIGPETDYAAILDAFEYMIDHNGRRRDARHTITHTGRGAVGVANRFRQLGILADGHPVPWAFDAAGVSWSSSSDYPVRDFWPLTRIESGVRAADAPSDALAKMIASHTMGSAYLTFGEDRRGSIERRKEADLVVLEKNLFDVAPDQIFETKTLMTVADGDVVFRDPSITIERGPRNHHHGHGHHGHGHGHGHHGHGHGHHGHGHHGHGHHGHHGHPGRGR